MSRTSGPDGVTSAWMSASARWSRGRECFLEPDRGREVDPPSAAAFAAGGLGPSQRAILWTGRYVRRKPAWMQGLGRVGRLAVPAMSAKKTSAEKASAKNRMGALRHGQPDRAKA